MASDRTSTMRLPYDNSAIIATKRGKGASSRKLTVGKRVANARPFDGDRFVTAKECDANNDLY